MPPTLSSRERAALKARAHALEPVVRLGHAGVTPELAAEVDRALTAHELIKVTIAVEDRDERATLGNTLAERLDAARVHRIGKILILWRPRRDDVEAEPRRRDQRKVIGVFEEGKDVFEPAREPLFTA